MQNIDPVTNVDIQDGKILKQGKVRTIYDLGENLLIVASDRVSAFDVVLNQGIPGKGAILTQISKFWFKFFADTHKSHFISDDIAVFGKPFTEYPQIFDKRSMLTKKLTIFPVECIVRGYIVGSGYKEYLATGAVSGLKLAPGLRFADRLPEPIFTPSTKAEIGEHDENISFEKMIDTIGADAANTLKQKSLAMYEQAAQYALERGIIIADTKFEFGYDENGEIFIADEVFTPDSSRFWDLEKYKPGESVTSFDKQVIRDYLETIDWDKKPPCPVLPSEIIQKTAEQYSKIFDKLTK